MSDLCDYMKSRLQPGGSLPLVRMGFLDGMSGAAYLQKDFVHAAVDEMDRRLLSCVMDELSPLEKLGIELLLSAAHISDPQAREAALAQFTENKSECKPETKRSLKL